MMVNPHEQTTNQAALAAIRRFNRFELKYLADRDLVRAFRDDLPDRLVRDANGLDGFYPVWSIYYDTRDLQCYWEKIDGERFRRKLRIRHYGSPSNVAPDSPVWVEIKQRINRATQKRRLQTTYEEARRLCDGHEPADYPGQDQDAIFIDEILTFTGERQLRPTTVVGYVREAFVGLEEDSGLRVTIDSRVRARDRDLEIGMESENRLIVPPRLSIIEIKVNERIPYWLTEIIARHNLSLVRVSKYCQSIEAFGRAPRSMAQLALAEL